MQRTIKLVNIYGNTCPTKSYIDENLTVKTTAYVQCQKSLQCSDSNLYLQLTGAGLTQHVTVHNDLSHMIHVHADGQAAVQCSAVTGAKHTSPAAAELVDCDASHEQHQSLPLPHCEVPLQYEPHQQCYHQNLQEFNKALAHLLAVEGSLIYLGELHSDISFTRFTLGRAIAEAVSIRL